MINPGDTMFKRQLETLFIVTCIFLTIIPYALGSQNNTISVNATSITGAQTEINSAINYLATNSTPNSPGYVLLNAGTYNLSGSVNLKSNIVIKGVGNDTIIFANGSVCNTAKEPAYIFGTNISNVEISNLQFKSTAEPLDGGRGIYSCVRLMTVNNSSIHDLLIMPYHYGDGVRIETGNNTSVYNSNIGSGHDSISFLLNSSNCRAYNNSFDIRINTGVRVRDSKDIRLDHNTFTGIHESGWCCTEMEENLSNIEIDHNIFHDYIGSNEYSYYSSAAVQPRHANGSLHIHDNVLWNVGNILMGSGSGNISNPPDENVEDWVAQGYGCGSNL
jgi:hypothetical protein